MAALIYTAVPQGTNGTIKANAKRFDEPDGQVVDISDNSNVIRPLISETTTPTGLWVSFISVHDDRILWVKGGDVGPRFIAVPDSVLQSITDRTVAYMDKSLNK